MKGEYKFQRKMFNYTKKTIPFKVIIICLILLNLFQGGLCAISYGINVSQLHELLILIFSNDIYLFLTFILYLFNTVYLYQLFSSNQFYHLRNKTKNNCTKKIIGAVLFSNTFIFILNLLFLFIYVLILYIFNFNYSIKIPNVSSIIYFLWYFIRCYIWIQIFSIYTITISKIFSPKVTTTLIATLLLLIFYYGNIPSDLIINSITDIRFSIYRFLLPLNYSSFPFELSINILYILLSMLILQIIETLINKKTKITMQTIKNSLYLIKHSFNTVIRKLKWLIIIYIILLVSLILWFYNGINIKLGIDEFTYILGISYKYGDELPKLLISLISWLTYTYISFKIILRDTQLKNEIWFLRLKPIKLIIIKIVSVFLITMALKSITYTILYIIFSINTKLSLLLIFKYFLNDLIFTTIIELTAVMCLFTSYSLEKFKTISLVFFIPMLLLLSKPIITQNIIYLISVMLINIILIIGLFQKKGRIIFENIENGG